MVLKNLIPVLLLVLPVTSMGAETQVTLSGGEQIRIVHDGAIRAIHLKGGSATITSIENLSSDRALESAQRVEEATRETQPKEALTKETGKTSEGSGVRMTWAKPKIED